VAFLLDRRVDPGQKVKVSARDVPLQKVMERIAANGDMRLSQFGPVAYFGPPEAVARLRTLSSLVNDAMKQLPPEIHQRFFVKRGMKWEDFATPRVLLQELAAGNQLQIVGIERVPHDLWAAADLPPLTLNDRFTLILNQFDLSFRVAEDGRQMTVIPIPANVGIVRAYPGGATPEATVQRYAMLAPDAKIKLVDGTVWVKGLLEDHEQITRGKPPEPVWVPPGPGAVGPVGPWGPGPATDPVPEPAPPKVDLANKRFTIKVKNTPVGDLIHGLALRLQLQLKMDDKAIQEAKIDLSKLVSFDVKEATADELFKALLKDVPLTHQLDGNVLEILPKK